LWFIALQKLKTEDGTRSSASSNSALKAEQAGLRNRSPSKMTKYVECWGADKPFANITESTLAKNIGLTVSISYPPCQFHDITVFRGVMLFPQIQGSFFSTF
jgi:hypothetical protein